jgi:ATP-dependent protease ClpP protease subunit
MTKFNQKKTKTIAFLLVISVLLPFIGYFIAADIEESQSSPSGGLLAWTIMCGLCLLFLWFAHHLAKKHYQLKSIGTVGLMAAFVFVGTFGWIANGAWYNYYFFSEYLYPEFSVLQDNENPNQFLFKGSLFKDSGNAVIRRVLNADNVDWDKPIALEIHSEGGNPQEAILLSEFVNHYNIQVEVIGKCISACTLVLLSSNQRYIHPRAWIGFHATYMNLEGNEPNYDPQHLRFYDELLEKNLTRLKVSSDFKQKTKVQDAKGGFYPSFDQLLKEKITNTPKRLYIDEVVMPFYL